MLGQAAALRASARPSLRAPSASAAAVAPVVLHVSDRLDTAWLARRQRFHVPSLRPDCPPLLQVDLGDTDVTTGARAIDNLWVLVLVQKCTSQSCSRPGVGGAAALSGAVYPLKHSAVASS